MGKKVLCGVQVDEKDYTVLSEKEYAVSVPENDNPYNPGKKFKLRQVEFYAKATDYRREFPVFSKACQKIVEQASQEIRQYYADKDGRKGYKIMKHDSFDGYLKDLQEVHKKASGERQELQATFSAAEAAWNNAQKDKGLNDYELTAAKMKWLDAKNAYNQAIKGLQSRTKEDIGSIQKEFEEHIIDFYSANGDRMDDGTIRLLNSGLKLTDGEIDRLCSQNANNPTMLRLISDHCDRNKLNNKNARVLGTVARSAGANEKQLFNSVVSLVEKVIGEDSAIASKWSSENGLFEQYSNEAIRSMAGNLVKPPTNEQ